LGHTVRAGRFRAERVQDRQVGVSEGEPVQAVFALGEEAAGVDLGGGVFAQVLGDEARLRGRGDDLTERVRVLDGVMGRCGQATGSA
jgi:hypothetical protein